MFQKLKSVVVFLKIFTTLVLSRPFGTIGVPFAASKFAFFGHNIKIFFLNFLIKYFFLCLLI